MTGRLLAAVASGAALGVAGPPWGYAWLAWGGLVPTLLAMRALGPGRAACLGWVTGVVWHAVALRWLVGTLDRYTALGPVGVESLWLATAACVGLSVGAACGLTAWATRRGWPVGIALPVAWVAMEGLHGWPIASFPWTPLGLSQHAVAGVAGLAAVVGTGGLSIMLVGTNVLVTEVLVTGRVTGLRWLPVGGVLAVVALVALGPGRGRAGGGAGDTVLRVGVVQGHVPPEERRSPYDKAHALRRYERLTADVAAQADLLVWPEAAVPYVFGEAVGATRRIRAVARTHGRPLLFGSAGGERIAPGRVRYTNRALLLDATGTVRATYTKRHLVPFGEMVPYGRWLPGVRPFVGTPRDVEPGAGPAVLSLLPGAVPAGVLLCFEITVPALAREAVAAGARVLVNLPNDGWFSDGAGSAQSLAHAQLRAIELGVPVLRVANDGPSARIDPTGRVTWRAAGGHALSAVVPVGIPAVGGRTLYAQLGWLGCPVVWSILGLMVCVPWRRARG